MKAAFITEDESDSEVVGTLVGRILGREIPRTHYLSRRGFGAVLSSAPPLALQAARAQVELIIVLVDCDETDDHYSLPVPHANCRLCELMRALPSAHRVAEASNRSSRLVAALTVRTIESWLAIGGSLSVPGSIHAFGRSRHERSELKRIVYGDAQPSGEVLRQRGVEIARAANLEAMETTLNSFAAFASLVRG